jgi:hypothetical protein
MPEGLQEAISQSVDTGGDTAPATPEAAPAAVETTPTETPTPADTAETPATGESEWKIDSTDFDNQHPELAPYRKQLQADYTRRQQELAEKQRLTEGLDEGSIQWMRDVRRLAQTNPEVARQLMEAEAQRLAPQAPPPQEEPVWYSDGERVLAQQVQQLQQTVRQQELAYQKAAVEAETAQLERTIGKSLTPQERDGLYTFCAQKRVNLDDGWKLMDYDRAVQRGMDKAGAMQQQKAGMGPAPGTTASREVPAADREPKTAREALEMAYAEAEKRAA